MFRRKYDVSGEMARELPNGIQTVKISTISKNGNDNSSSKAFTNVGFVEDVDDNDRSDNDNDTMDVKRVQTETLDDTIKNVTPSAQDTNEGSVKTFTNGATSSSASSDSKGDSAMDVRTNADQINSEISETNNDDPDSGCNESDTQSYSAKRRNSKLGRSTSQEHNIQTDIIQPSDGHTVSNQQTVSLDDNSTSAETEFSDDAWRLSIEDFTSKRQGSKRKNRKLSKEMRSYYKKQDENIDVYAEIRGKTFG